MKHIQEFKDFSISENASYHLEKGLDLFESVFRIGSDAWLNLVCESRDLFNSGKIGLTEEEIWLIGTDVGETAIFEDKIVLLDIPFEDEEEISEAEYRGRKVNLNKPFRTPPGPRKFGVYTKNDKGNVVKVGFGEPGMRIRNDDPARARSFRKRMRCDNPGPKWKPRWWACNISRYRKLLGIKSSRPW